MRFLPLLSLLRARSSIAFAVGLASGVVLQLRRAVPGRRAPATASNVHHSGDAVISTDAHRRIVLANLAAGAMFGVPVEDMQGSPLARFILGADEPGMALMGNAGSAGTTRAGRRFTDHIITGLHADGHQITLSGSLSHKLHDGHKMHRIILRDAATRQRVQARMARSHEELRQLSAALQTIREQERTHIARELHDDLGQLLASLRMDLTLLQRDDASSAARQRLMAGMQANLATALASLRRIATNLRPRALDDGGLYFALKGLRDDFTRRYQIACTLYADEDELQFNDNASTAVFRIVQEALTNIARHAQAHDVTLNLYRLDGELLVTIRDDGRGIGAADFDKPGSLGLVGMRERVWGMQGEIVVSADEPPGTRIDIVLPIRQHLL